MDNTWFAQSVLEPPELSEGELFFEHYEAIRDWIGCQSRAGLAAVALSPDGVQAKFFLPVSDRGVLTAILGRHERAEISLSGDPTLSLRHLAVIVRGGTFRLVDLRTWAGFSDLEGRQLRACETDDSLFVRCGSYSVLFAPTSTNRTWPEEPEGMWGALRRSRAAELEPATLDDCLLSKDERALGELVIRSDDGEGRMLLGQRAARAGVLLGRSDRCDGDTLLRDPHISRVHLLIAELGGSLYAIDTVSKNGVWGRGGERRTHLLESGAKISLCGLATIEWRFIH